MNAVEFVKKHGWDEAQETVKENSKQLRILSTWEVELKRLVERWELIAKFDGLEECKRIVSSAPSGAIGYHTMYEGYFDEKSKLYYEGLNQCLIVDLEQAIADVESVGGGV